MKVSALPRLERRLGLRRRLGPWPSLEPSPLRFLALIAFIRSDGTAPSRGPFCYEAAILQIRVSPAVEFFALHSHIFRGLRKTARKRVAHEEVYSCGCSCFRRAFSCPVQAAPVTPGAGVQGPIQSGVEQVHHCRYWSGGWACGWGDSGGGGGYSSHSRSYRPPPRRFGKRRRPRLRRRQRLRRALPSVEPSPLRFGTRRLWRVRLLRPLPATGAIAVTVRKAGTRTNSVSKCRRHRDPARGHRHFRTAPPGAVLPWGSGPGAVARVKAAGRPVLPEGLGRLTSPGGLCNLGARLNAAVRGAVHGVK